MRKASRKVAKEPAALARMPDEKIDFKGPPPRGEKGPDDCYMY